MMETELLDQAIALAQTAHANQVDKAGTPYIGHPLRVMNSLKRIAEPTEKDWKRLRKYQEVLPKLQAALSRFESS